MTKDDAIKAIEGLRSEVEKTALHKDALFALEAAIDHVRALPDAGWREEDVNRVAVAMWRGESVRAAPNVAKQRTAEAFAEESQSTIDRWTGLARIALEAALPPPPEKA
jgi:hypothetical protein